MTEQTTSKAPDWAANLTDKQRAFVEEYMVDLNGTQAAVRAGYSEDSARSIASENLSKPYIAEAVDKLLGERPGITRARIVDELARIGFAEDADPKDKLSALEKLGKAVGLFKDRIEHSGPGGKIIQVVISPADDRL